MTTTKNWNKGYLAGLKDAQIIVLRQADGQGEHDAVIDDAADAISSKIERFLEEEEY